MGGILWGDFPNPAVVQNSPLRAPSGRARNTAMYLRRQRRAVNGVSCEYWTLVESRRTARGPRQHPVATLGKLPGLDEQVHAGWESIDALLEGRAPAKQLEFSGPPQPPAPP